MDHLVANGADVGRKPHRAPSLLHVAVEGRTGEEDAVPSRAWSRS